MKGLGATAGRVAAGLLAAALTAPGLVFAFSAWLRPGYLLDWLAAFAFCG